MTRVCKEKVVVMSEASERRSGILAGARPTSEGDTVTTFELFFDLVYVFAATRVTGYMSHAHDAPGVLQGLLILALLWSTWDGYAWLGNQVRTDTGVVRAAMAVAMAGMFVVALAIPEAWDDAEGGLNGPLVLVVAYLLVRCVHLTVYTLVARGDIGLRRQLVLAWGPTVAGAILLVAGALLGGRAQTAFFAAAFLVEWGIIYLTSREGNWRMHSAPHLTERHGQFVLLAIGESLFAIGVGAAGQPISLSLLVAAVLGVAAALCLWWLYFDEVSRTAEHRLRDAQEQARVRMAIEAYAYGHFPIVAGIIIGAVGVEGVLAQPVTASRWASSMPQHCTAGSRSISPGTCCSCSVWAPRSACRGSSRPASCCSSCRRRRFCHHSSGWRGWCSYWVS